VANRFLSAPLAFERGDRVYLTTPVLLGTPSDQQIEEFAFASAVRQRAPNENIGWLQGRYVQAGRANLNGAMWRSDELALKSLTPMLCPVTVMHDPRTAVGCIADCKLFSEAGATRLETILGVWRHRFPEVWDEAEANIARGELAQSMEVYAPFYSCSKCERTYIKLPQGAERASWCDCLVSNQGWRILGDTCFTGTGLIFGSRGGVPAYSEATLEHFQDEVAECHERAHADATYRPHRSASHMALVQIEESELATLRRERDEGRARTDELANANRDLTGKAERAEAAQKAAESQREQFERELSAQRETVARQALKERRIAALGAGFMARLGETSKARLGELAATCSDEQWNTELTEREELAGVKRDTPAANGQRSTPAADLTGSFSSEELASFLARSQASDQSAPVDSQSTVRQLARAFAKRK
jgi:hypothetical protein